MSRLALLTLLLLASALSGRAALTYKSRYLAPGTALPSTAQGYEDLYNSLPDGVAGYCETTVSLWNDIENSALCGANEDVAYRFRASFTHSGPAATYYFRLGADFGLGGFLKLDSDYMAFSTDDLWWAGNWNPSETLQGSATIEAGEHVLDFLGFEQCCDGFQRVEFKINDGPWLVLGDENLDLEEEPIDVDEEPEFVDNTPEVVSSDDDTIVLRVRTNVESVVSCDALPKGSAAPTPEQVSAMNYWPSISQGNVAVAANADGTITLSNVDEQKALCASCTATAGNPTTTLAENIQNFDIYCTIDAVSGLRISDAHFNEVNPIDASLSGHSVSLSFTTETGDADVSC